MKLSVVIVNYKVRFFLAQCLRSLQISLRNIDAEVFVVDNNSQDGSVEYLQPLFPWVKFIANHTNPGFSIANNQAINQSLGEYVLLLNPDTLVGENTLDRACQFMDENMLSGAVGVKMIDACGQFLPESKRGFPSPWTSFCKMFGLSKLFPQSPLFAKYHLRYLNENEIHEVEVLSGAFMMLRKSVLDKIGLLDEAFFMYGEDIDLSYRITQGGYKNFYLPELIIHYKGESTKKDLRYVKIFYQAMVIFFTKHFPNYASLYQFMVKGAICTHGFFSAIGNLCFKRRKNPKPHNLHFLVLSDKKNLLAIKTILSESFENNQYTLIEANSNQSVELKKIEDLAFDRIVFDTQFISFENIMRLMDGNKKKNACHIYHPELDIILP